MRTSNPKQGEVCLGKTRILLSKHSLGYSIYGFLRSCIGHFDLQGGRHVEIYTEMLHQTDPPDLVQCSFADSYVQDPRSKTTLTSREYAAVEHTHVRMYVCMYVCVHSNGVFNPEFDSSVLPNCTVSLNQSQASTRESDGGMAFIDICPGSCIMTLKFQIFMHAIRTAVRSSLLEYPTGS